MLVVIETVYCQQLWEVEFLLILWNNSSFVVAEAASLSSFKKLYILSVLYVCVSIMVYCLLLYYCWRCCVTVCLCLLYF